MRTHKEQCKSNIHTLPQTEKNLGHAPLLHISVKKTPYTPPTFKFGIPRVLVSDPSQGTHFIFALSPPSLTPTTHPPIDLGFFFFGLLCPQLRILSPNFMKLTNFTPNRGTLWITLLLQWKTNLSIGDGRKNVAPFKLSKPKKKEKRKCIEKKRKNPWAFFYIREGPVSCLTNSMVCMLCLET
jgi:hypothetical protein